MALTTFTTEDIGSELNARRIGRQIVVLGETTSTNDVAILAADREDADGLVVFADYQTRGRGRQGRLWSSPRGASVLCTVLLIDRDDSAAFQTEPGVLTLAAGVAACDAISIVGEDLHPTIRWPNDVLIGRRKVAGVLIESCLVRAGRAYAMGIGVNCLQHRRHFEKSLERTATSMEAESSHPVNRVAVARQLLIELDRWLAGRPDTQLLRRAWLDRAEPLGQHIHLRQGGEDFIGRTIDVDPTAALIVQLDGGGRRVFDPATTTLVRAGSRLQPGS